MKDADRRRDHSLRETIEEYRQLAAEAKDNASKSKDDKVRSQYLSLAASLETLIEALQGRPPA